MTVHAPVISVRRVDRPPTGRIDRLERDLADARRILHRLLEAEDRLGLVYPVMDEARGFLARTRYR